MQIIAKEYISIAPEIKRQLLGLTVRGKKSESWVVHSTILSRVRSWKDRIFVIMALKNNMVLGWVLVDHYLDDINIYVRRSHRRTGVGKALIKKTNEIFGRMRCHRHDEISSAFFHSVRGLIQ